MRFLILIIFVLAFIGCKEEKAFTTSPSPSEVKHEEFFAEPMSLTSWGPGQDSILKLEILKNPALLKIDPKRMSTVCPKWLTMTDSHRVEGLMDIFRAIAKRESSHKALTMYWEDSMDNDRLTKKSTISEGYFQLSYQDSLSYSGCKFDWAKDQKAFLDDYKNKTTGKWYSKHPERTIVQPQINIACGVFIAGRLMVSEKRKNDSFEKAMSAYWSVMNPNVSLKKKLKGEGSSFSQTLKEIRRTSKQCY
jgi:hypothetical protein